MTSDIKVKVRINQKGNLLAQADVVFGDIIEIHGWRVMSSTKIHPRFQEQLWIQEPCYRSANGKWKPIVWIADKKLYEEIESKIYDTYTLTKANTPPINQDKVTPDDIPF